MTSNKHSRRSFFKGLAATSLGVALAPSLLKATVKGADDPERIKSIAGPVEPIWRNRQSGMQYRQLGRTGMMVSEIALGTNNFNSVDRYPVFDACLERGVNYFDTAYSYQKGETETNIGKYLKQNGRRDDIFISTKLSSYYDILNKYSEEIAKSLPAAKHEAIKKRAKAMMDERTVTRPGYHISFWDGQASQMEYAYFRHLLLEEYGRKKEWRQQILNNAYKVFDEALSRLQTDYVDVLHIPHGISMPEEMDGIIPEIFETLKKKGALRASGVSFHNDVSGNLLQANKVGYYDVAMFTYNIANHSAIEIPMFQARESGMGLLAMKVVRMFAQEGMHPEWIKDKMNNFIPDNNLSLFAKSYKWALMNPNLTSCVSEMETIAKLEDNLQVVGM